MPKKKGFNWQYVALAAGAVVLGGYLYVRNNLLNSLASILSFQIATKIDTASEASIDQLLQSYADQHNGFVTIKFSMVRLSNLTPVYTWVLPDFGAIFLARDTSSRNAIVYFNSFIFDSTLRFYTQSGFDPASKTIIQNELIDTLAAEFLRHKQNTSFR